jgi:hypothetical protein
VGGQTVLPSKARQVSLPIAIRSPDEATITLDHFRAAAMIGTDDSTQVLGIEAA